MTERKWILGLFLLSLVAAGVGFFVSETYECGYSIFCYTLFTKTGPSLFYGMGALSFVFLLLLAVPQAFVAWKKFAIWFIPIAALIFIFYQEPSSGDFVSPYPEVLFRWLGALYVVVSISIISLHVYRTNRR